MHSPTRIAIGLFLAACLLLMACRDLGPRLSAESRDVQVSPASVAAPTTLYLVRHAEKDIGPGADPTNPPLTDVGRARAEQLVQVLTKVDLAAVYSTPYVRAVNTVAPVAAAKGLSIREYNPKLDLRVLVDSLVALHRGEAILVVGHSNTIPGMLNALAGQTRYPELGDGDHDGLYRAVVLPHSAGASQARGAPLIDELRVPLCR